jgi:hypothetical protein
MQLTVCFETLTRAQVLSFLTAGSRQRWVLKLTSGSVGIRTDLDTIIIKKIEPLSSSLTACSTVTTLTEISGLFCENKHFCIYMSDSGLYTSEVSSSSNKTDDRTLNWTLAVCCAAHSTHTIPGHNMLPHHRITHNDVILPIVLT